MAVVDPSYQFLACQYLREQLDTLMSELRGVRANEDIEPVHQARVASRRIRAALKMFVDCFEAGKAARWRRQVRKLTRELGAARDKDVQMEFVAKLLSGLDPKDRKHRPGVARLLLRLRQRRAALQPEVVAVLDKLDRKNALARIYGQVEKMLFALRSHDVSVCSPYVYEMAAEHIRARREEFFDRESTLADPEDIRGHHQLRIGAKKLRYTLEICDAAYGGQLADVIKATRKVQSFLGDIHDCDVWAQEIETFMEQERLATIEYCGQSRPFNRLKPGLLYVREERQTHRRQVFAELLDYWKTLNAKHVWEELEKTLKSRMKASDPSCDEPQDRQIDVGKEGNEADRTAR